MKKHILLIIIIFLVIISQAQIKNNTDTSIFKPITKFSFVPQYLIFNGIRLDYEKEFSTNNWYIISPTIYLGKKTDTLLNINERDNYFNNLLGIGLGICYKRILGNYYIINTYFSVGLRYNFFYIDYFGFEWETSIVNGNEVIKYNLVNINEQIHRIDGNFTLGFDAEIFPNIFIDSYVGIGLKYSYPVFNRNVTANKFDDNMWSYAYTGTALVIGIKIGFIHTPKRRIKN